MPESIVRCPWALRHPLEIHYHDTIWGKPEYNSKALFKMLLLEGQQAGLSWLTILKKMEGLCAAFDNFDPEKLAAYDQEKIESLMQNDAIIKNRLKIQAAVHNAKVYLSFTEKNGSFSDFLWNYVGGKPIINQFESMEEHPAFTSLSDQISKDLKKLGF